VTNLGAVFHVTWAWRPDPDRVGRRWGRGNLQPHPLVQGEDGL